MTAAKLLFAGTPDFALASLRALHGAGFMPDAVLTQPDRPAGRGKKISESPVKLFAREHDIAVWQPQTLKDAEIVAQVSKSKPDLIIVAAYGPAQTWLRECPRVVVATLARGGADTGSNS